MPEHSFNKNLQREVQFNPQEFDENHHQQVQEAPLQQNDKGIQSMNVLKEQIKVFAIVYVSYIYIHIYREFWSMSKKALLQQSHSKFDEETLASFDTAYLFVYSVATFVGGVVGDIYDLRKLLSFSMFMLSLSYFALGLGGYSDIEDPAYYYIVFFFIGIFSSPMFPSIIHLLGSWFSQTNRGLILGLWATSANIGNIIGVQVAAILLRIYNNQWYHLFFTISGLILFGSLIVFVFLKSYPEDCNITISETENGELHNEQGEQQQEQKFIQVKEEKSSDREKQSQNWQISDQSPSGGKVKIFRIGGDDEDEELDEKVQQKQQLQNQVSSDQPSLALNTSLNIQAHQKSLHQSGQRITFWKAWLLPRVFLYASTLFCIKLAVNSMLLWLPLLLKEYLNYQTYQIANLSSFFDSGAILGSFSLGYLSDKLYSKRSPIAFMAIIGASIIGFTINSNLQTISIPYFSVLMFFFGFIVSGLNNIISASCAADIGKQSSLKNNQRSQGTVAGIIDGSGSLGSAFGQIVIGESVKNWGWDKFMLIISIDITLTMIPMFRILVTELKEIYYIIRSKRQIKD
eukprot:403338943